MDTGQISIDAPLTGKSPLTERISEKPSASFWQKAFRTTICIVELIVIIVVLIFIFKFFKSFSYHYDLVNYNKYPFLRVTSSRNASLQWDVFVDNPHNQVFLVKNLPKAYKGRRLLTQIANESSSFQIIQHKFDDKYIKLYTVFEGDFDHVHCFTIKTNQSSELIPQARAFSAGIHTDLTGNLLKFHWPDLSAGELNSTEFVTVQVIEPFDIYHLKSKLSKSGECYEYSHKFGKPEVSYDTSPMKSSAHFRAKFNASGPFREYGNWCELIEKGGFNQNCEKECDENLWQPTQKCLACRPPLDYTDRQCMMYEMCARRHQKLGWGSSGCVAKSGDMVSVPCECHYDFLKGLEDDSLSEECKGDLGCSDNGRRIRESFRNFPCGCKLNTCYDIPVFEKSDVSWEKKCIEYEACVPITYCNSTP